MRKAKFLEVYLISYFYIVFSAITLFGGLIGIFFIHETRKVDKLDHMILLLFAFIFIFNVFCIFFAVKFIRHKNIGRIGMLCCCIAQILFLIPKFFSTIKSFSFLDVIVLLIGLLGLWYLNTKEAKEWIVME